jgi:hypothetical protein
MIQEFVNYAPMPRISKIDCIILVLWNLWDWTRSQAIIIIVIYNIFNKNGKNDQQQLH